MRRMAVVHRITIELAAPVLRAMLRPADAPSQRVQMFDFECEPEPAEIGAGYDDYTNRAIDLTFTSPPRQCRLTATSVVVLHPRSHPRALERPWEHAVIESIRLRRRVDALAEQCAQAPVRSLPEHRPLRDVVEQFGVEELRDAGLAVRCVVGYRLGDPAVLHRWHEIYSPDSGWVDLDRNPKITVAWGPPEATLGIGADPEWRYASELDVFDL